jgi:methyl-accepting chemotaxis protein
MKHWSLTRKLWSLLGVSCLAGIGCAGFLLYQLQATVAAYRYLEFHDMRDVEEACRLGIEFKTEVQEWKNILLRGANPADLKHYTESLHERGANVRAKAGELSATAAMPEVRQMLRQFAQMHETLDATYEKALLVLAASGGRAVQQGDRMVRGQDRPLTALLDQTIDTLSENAKATVAAQDAAARRIGPLALGGVSVIFSLLAVFGWLILRGLVGVLRHATAQLSEGSWQVASASRQVASSSQALAQGASEQAASLEEISATLEEIAAMTHRNSDNSTSARAMMAETAGQVERSHEALSEMVKSMDGIKSSSEKVARINKTIDEIAFQTNILALNAAVEAARAGEAGMGFAVVANEVRTLAQRAAAAARDTETLIEEALANSRRGAQTLDQVSEAIRGITASAAKVRHLVDEVNEASKQQTEGVSQVSTAVTKISMVTQSTAASAEQSAAASEEMNSQAESLREIVRDVRVVVEGADTAAHAAAKRPEEIAGAGASGALRNRGAHRTVEPLASLRAKSTCSMGAKPAEAAQRDDPFPMENTESFRNF